MNISTSTKSAAQACIYPTQEWQLLSRILREILLTHSSLTVAPQVKMGGQVKQYQYHPQASQVTILFTSEAMGAHTYLILTRQTIGGINGQSLAHLELSADSHNLPRVRRS